MILKNLDNFVIMDHGDLLFSDLAMGPGEIYFVFNFVKNEHYMVCEGDKTLIELVDEEVNIKKLIYENNIPVDADGSYRVNKIYFLD